MILVAVPMFKTIGPTSGYHEVGCPAGVAARRTCAIAAEYITSVFPLDGCNSSSSLNIVTMASGDDWETTDVLVCGCGPTGAMLSGYLGGMGVHNIVLEKEPDITTDPRGIALDDDGIRFLQGLGLYRHIFTDIGTC